MADVKDLLKKRMHYQTLLVIYGDLLTDKQKMILDEYFASDLSFSEISQNHNITRSAVCDTIKKGINRIEEYENKLHIAQKHYRIIEKLNMIENKENKKVIDEIKELLDYGI